VTVSHINCSRTSAPRPRTAASALRTLFFEVIVPILPPHRQNKAQRDTRQVYRERILEGRKECQWLSKKDNFDAIRSMLADASPQKRPPVGDGSARPANLLDAPSARFSFKGLRRARDSEPTSFPLLATAKIAVCSSVLSAAVATDTFTI